MGSPEQHETQVRWRDASTEIPREDAQCSLVPYNPRAYEKMNRHWALRILYRRASSLHSPQGYFKRTSYSDRSRPVPSVDSQNAAPTADPTEPLAWACDRLPQPHGSSFAPLSFSTFHEESLQPVKSVIRQAQCPYSSGAQVQVGSSGCQQIQIAIHPLSRHANQFPMWEIDGADRSGARPMG
jgi:hypothetical protein